MPLENMKFKLDTVNAMIQTLPQSTREIISNADELIRRSDILVNTCNELYLQVKDAGAYVKRPTGIFSIATARDAAMYLSKHDYDSPLDMSSAAIPGLFKNIPMSISLQLNGLFVIPDGEYLTIKYYHDKDNLPVGSFWKQIQENTLKYKNDHYVFPHIISVSDLNFEKEIENFKKYAKVVIFEMAAAIRAAEKTQRLDTIKEAGNKYELQ